MYDVTIIGAGASGVMCALALKEKNKSLKVLLLEKNDKLGKKLSITGNGRCNLGNTNTDISNFNSDSNLSDFKNVLEVDNFDFLNVLDNTDDMESYYDYLIRCGVLITKEKGTGQESKNTSTSNSPWWFGKNINPFCLGIFSMT